MHGWHRAHNSIPIDDNSAPFQYEIAGTRLTTVVVYLPLPPFQSGRVGGWVAGTRMVGHQMYSEANLRGLRAGYVHTHAHTHTSGPSFRSTR